MRDMEKEERDRRNKYDYRKLQSRGRRIGCIQRVEKIRRDGK
jgi:hypothetical protein